MNKRIFMLMAAALALLSASGQVEFTGVGEYPVIEITLSSSHGSLNKIYVLYDTDGVGMTYASTTGKRAVWKSYDSQTWGNPQEIRGVRWDGYATKLDQVLPNRGYHIIEEGNDYPFYCWVVNYADYYLTLNDMFCESETPCGQLLLRVDGTGPAINYTNIDGRTTTLDREMELSYSTLEWDDSLHWQEKPVVKELKSLDNVIRVDQPLCNTVFQIRGDRFLEQWGLEEMVESRFYETQAVSCGSTAVLLDQDTNSENPLENGELLSAPAHILFTGYPTDAVVYRVWEIATDYEMENVILQFNQDELDYTFDDTGTFYVRYSVANAAGDCDYEDKVYTIALSESELGIAPKWDIPNIFTPYNKDGVNDVWKVPHKSIVEFHCWIYNRWGNQVYEFTDPDGGWDGYYRGKLVDTGVYYYVITATGSDGRKWKKRGDITILNYTRNKSSGGDTGTGFEQ